MTASPGKTDEAPTLSGDERDEDDRHARESINWSVSETELQDSLKSFRQTGGNSTAT